MRNDGIIGAGIKTMKIGVISDTHDNVPRIHAAVRMFNALGVDAVLHCGDFVAPFALLPFKDLSRQKLIMVFGNNDGETAGINSLAQSNGWVVARPPHTLNLGGRKIGMLHEPDRLVQLAGDGGYDLICYGHTHKTRAQREGNALLLNPGEGGGWLSGRATLAEVELDTLEVRFHEIGEEGPQPPLL